MIVNKRMHEAASLRGNRWQATFLAVLMSTLAMPAFSQSVWDPGLNAVPTDRLCTAGFNQNYGWFSVDGFFGMVEFPGLLQQNACLANVITPAALKVQLGQQSGQLTLPVARSNESDNGIIVTYSTGTPAVGVALAEPALCEDYFGTGTGEATWDFNIADANGESMIANVRGVASLAYDLNSGALAPTMVPSYGTTEWLRCFSGLAANAGNDPVVPVDPDLLYTDGFEDPLVPAIAPNLRVDFLNAAGDALLADDVISQSSILGSSVEFTVRISNVGNIDATDVRVREFVPTVSTLPKLLRPIVKRVECLDQSNGAACSNGTGNSPFRQTIGTLLQGAHRDFRFKRQVCRENAPASCVASSADELRALIQVAAFSHPGTVESSYADNSRALRIRVVDNVQITYRVSTDGSTANTSGGGLTHGTLPGGCAASGNVITCGPTTTGLVFNASANNNFTFTGFTSASCGASSGVSFTGGTFTTTTASTCTVEANFRTKPVVTVNPITNGAINSTNPLTVHYGDGNPATTADNAVFTITPNPGWSVATMTGCPSATSVDNGNGTWAITVANVQASCSLTVGLSQATYTVNAVLQGSGGSIFDPPAGTRTVGYGEPASFQFKALDATHEIETVTDTCGAGGIHSGATPYTIASSPVRWYGYTVSAVSNSCTVTAKFRLITYPVTVASPISNGSLNLVDVNVVHGSNAQYTLVPATGYHFVENSMSGAAPCGSFGGAAAGTGIATDATVSVAGTAGPITQAGCQLSAAFAINQYSVTVNLSGSHGGIAAAGSPSGGAGPVTFPPIAHGSSAEVWAFPDNGYHPEFQPVTGCSFIFIGTDNSSGAWKYKANSVTASCQVAVQFSM